jgi:hypothetical protein
MARFIDEALDRIARGRQVSFQRRWDCFRCGAVHQVGLKRTIGSGVIGTRLDRGGDAVVVGVAGR